MAFCAGREENSYSWQGNWDDSMEEREDALFGSLDEDELVEETAQDEAMDQLFSVNSADTMALDLVERLSWDTTSEVSSDEEEPQQLILPAETGEGDGGMQWGLVSPCSETASPTAATLSPLTRVSISSPVRKLRFFEPEQEPTVEQTKQVIEEEEDDDDDEEEEVTPFDPETCWALDLSSPAAKVSANPFTTYQPAEPEEMDDRTADDAISSDEKENQEKSVTSALRPSLLPRVPSIANWRRQKARTCSGAGSAGMPTALSLATFKARTRSLSRSRNQSVIDDEDDGDFSSDDEGYSPELHCRRASETEPLGASQWRRARHTSLNFSSHRLNVNVGMSPMMVTKRLQEAKSKLNNGLHLLRSGSTSSTVTSEESYLDSPACEEIKSAPAGVYREPSIFSDDATSTCTSLVSAASAYALETEQHHPTRQEQLRAGVFKAAGFLNAASTEAARKLKSRSFRAPHLPRQKAASETEEEDPEPCPVTTAP